MFTLENRLQGLRAWRLICITELVLATFSCDGEWHLGKVTDLILQCFSSSSRDQATVRSCCISDMNKAVLWKSLNQIWLVAESGAQLCPCHVCLPVATWGLCKREPLPPSQEVVAVSANLCLLKKKVTSQRLPELKCSWVLLNGRGKDSSWCLCSSWLCCPALFGLNLGIDGMSLSGEGSKTGTGYRISKACGLSNCTLSHADRSSDIKDQPIPL